MRKPRKPQNEDEEFEDSEVLNKRNIIAYERYLNELREEQFENLDEYESAESELLATY